MNSSTSSSALVAESCEIEVIDTDCFLLCNLLSLDEQVQLFESIDCRDKTAEYDMAPKACMYPSPKTLIFGRDDEGVNIPLQVFESREKSIVHDLIISRGTNVLNRQNVSNLTWNNRSKSLGNNDGGFSIKMAVIRYMSESPNSKFPRHIDHCDGSYVYLTSLGCTARFLVKGPNMTEKRILEMRSGDVLIFNASTAAAIEHGVEGIDGSETCPVALGERCPVLQNHRYGVQCRVNSFEIRQN
mmetsp:Transcript_18689/g.46252  ORF Transcript_18689/g.46252 Transcript_18689/m.46252 type:complete len:243 (-) Transcript_18689:2-730(-)